MAKLAISGSVVYSDLSPAAGAVVKIYDLDLLPGGSSDKILTKTTNSLGKFAGLSAEWSDREGTGLFGLAIPDVLNLEFRVSVDGKTHKGPYLLVGGHGAPIVLPFGPPKPVSRKQRDLVQLIQLSDGMQGAERSLYEFVEASSEGVAATILGPQYRKIHVLKGKAATLANFEATLKKAANTTGVTAVDVLMNNHGVTKKVVFADGQYSLAEAKAALLALPAGVRAKFRALFSTACFGESHVSMWNSVGFTTASGAKGIYADSAVSFAPMLASWALEGRFSDAIAAANAADVGNVADGLAIAFYNATGRTAHAAQVDSTRSTIGDASIRLYSSP